MACHLAPSLRDLLVRLFRAEVYRRVGYVEFPPQAEFRLATEGWELTPKIVRPAETDERPIDFSKVRVEDYPIIPKAVKLLVPCASDDPDAMQIGETENYAKYQWQLAIPRRAVVRGVLREGVIAHKASKLASFKMGKSKNIGMWATGFAILPGATIDMVGLEYGTSEHEYTYLCESLMGGSKPFISKGNIRHYYNDVRAGRMYLELTNGCSFGVRSYKNKDALRGGQITCYIFNEIYQLPGLQVYTGHAQNLRVEQGYAAFTSTPDRPWVKVLHKMGHGNNPDWFCSCDNNAFVNPFSFDLTGLMADVPDWDTLREHAPALLSMCEASGLQPGALMSKEKFLISWLGKMGGFVGRVYNFSRANITCYPTTHPRIFKPGIIREWADQDELVEELRLATLA